MPPNPPHWRRGPGDPLTSVRRSSGESGDTCAGRAAGRCFHRSASQTNLPLGGLATLGGPRACCSGKSHSGTDWHRLIKRCPHRSCGPSSSSAGRWSPACYTAARLHGFGVVPDSDLHLTTSEANSLHPPAGVVIHQRMLRSPAARTNGILATSPADTAIDVAAIVREIDVLAVLDSAVRAGVAPGSLQDALLRAARRRGIVQVRDQLPLVSAAAESAMESRTRFRLHEASLPRARAADPHSYQVGRSQARHGLACSTCRTRIRRPGVSFRRRVAGP